MPWWDVDLTGLFNFPQAGRYAGAKAANASALVSCNDTAGAPHVFYLANSKVVHGHIASSTSTSQNIPPAPLAPPVTGGLGSLWAFFDVNGGHVLYDALDPDSSPDPQLHQLTGAAWLDEELTAHVDPGSGISSFLDTTGSAHVFYIAGAHVHMLLFSLGGWTDQDLTSNAKAGQTSVPALSPLTSFQDSSGYHVFYVGNDSNVHELTLAAGATKWSDQSLSAKGVLTGSGLSGFVDSHGSQVYYVSYDQHVHRLISTTGTWTDTDLTVHYSGPQTATATALSSFGDGYGDHAVYISADQHVHQMYYDNANWVDQDLTGTAKPVQENQVPSAAVDSALSSLANSLGELIFYISADQHVHLLVFSDTPPVPPLAIACPTANAVVGAPYNSSLVASRGSATYTFALASGSSLPPGLYQSNSDGSRLTSGPWLGYISGTPTTATPPSYTFTVTATDANGVTGKTTCTITVAGPPTVEGCPPDGEVGVPYNFTLGASGVAPGAPGYTFAVSGMVPGLSFGSNGGITGMPMTAATYPISVTVTANNIPSEALNCSMTIYPELTLACPSATTGQAGQSYSSGLMASGGTGTGTYTFALTGGSLAGLSLNPSSGVITGTPTTVGTPSFTVTVTDRAGGSATAANCQINIGGTFVITAIVWYPGTPPKPRPWPDKGFTPGTPGYLSGPCTDLSFINFQTGQPVTAVQNPGGSGIYTVSGVMNGEQLALNPQTIGQDIELVTSTGGPASQWIGVTLSGASGSTTIYCELPAPFFEQ